MTEMTKNGVSTTMEPGSEKWEHFTSPVNHKRFCQYDYRHTDGELFSTTRSSLPACRNAKDLWLIGKEVE